jgi:Opacity protein and related surface antigens
MRTKFSILLTAALTLGTVQAASAADLPTKAPAYAPAPSYNWAGLYVGGNVGYSWGQQNTAPVALPGGTASTSASINGVIGGGQIGYNWQVNQIVLGLEADIQLSGQKGDFNTSFPLGGVPTTGKASQSLDYFGTVRGRVGYAWGQYLAYFTGGWAYGHVSFSGTAAALAPTDVFVGPGSTNDGWTVGGGLEWAFADRWSAKIEYLYVDLGSGSRVNVISTTHNLTATSGDLTDNIVRAGLNYRF